MEIFDQAEKTFMQMMDEDVRVFNLNREAGFCDKEMLPELIEVPLVIAENAADILKIADSLRPVVKNTVTADLTTAAYNLTTAVRGAVSIIECNYYFLADKPDYIEEIKSRVRNLRTQLHELN